MNSTMKNRPSSQKAFTFIEILIVALVIGLWYTGVKIAEIVPWFVLESVIAFGFFILLFMILRRILLEMTWEGHPLFDYRFVIWYLFLAHVLLVFVLRFAFLVPVWIAYTGSLLLLVILPVIGLHVYTSIKTHVNMPIAMDASRIHSIACKTETAQQFLEQYPDCKIFVFDHTAKNRFASCLFLQRNNHPELGDIVEDIILEFKVDMKKKQAVLPEIPYTRYLFLREEYGTSVLPLAIEDGLDSALPSKREIDLKLKSILGEFPPLDDAPLPIASRKQIRWETVV